MNRQQLRNRSGFTLMELMIAVGLTGIVGWLVASWATKPTAVYNSVAVANAQNLANNAANEIATDLQSADPATTFPWSPPSITSISINQLQYNFQNPSSPPVTLSINYSFTPEGNGLGTLMRTVNETSSIVLNHVVIPTPTSPPFVQQDSTYIPATGQPLYNVLVLSFQYFPPGLSAPVSIVRRISVTG